MLSHPSSEGESEGQWEQKMGGAERFSVSERE